jgi:hypothetical protein
MFAAAVKTTLEAVRRLGPYAAIELLLPGGTLIALLVWLYRRHRARAKSMLNGCHSKENKNLALPALEVC